MERWASTDYHLYRTSLPQSRDFWFQSLLMLALFTLINIVSSLFDLACVRYVLTILGLCVFGHDGCREPIPLVPTFLYSTSPGSLGGWLLAALRGSSYKCAGTSLIVSSILTTTTGAMLWAITTLDILGLTECARYAALVHRKWLTWAKLSVTKGVLTASCQVMCLASVTSFKFLFDPSEQLFHETSGCDRVDHRHEDPPIASHAPFMTWLFGQSLA
ncbi:hypothetical protein FOZ62_011923, partial [Perkinsus olseni]